MREILDRTLTVELVADPSGLGPGARQAIDELLIAGRVLQDLAETQRHHQAARARRGLVDLHARLGRPARTADLLTLWDVNQGPIATTLDNELLPFLPVDGWAPGRAFYPWGIGADEIEAFLDTRPDRRASLLDPRTVVRRTTPVALGRDLAVLRRRPELAALHPGLRERLDDQLAHPTREPLYAVPYSVAWPEPIARISRALATAADAVAPEDADLAAFLRLRSRDLLSDDNEGGDAAWVTGAIGPLDIVVGAYEEYEDDLFGVKTMFDLSIYVRDEERTAQARRRMAYLGDIEAALPGGRPGKARHAIPIGSFDVLGSFGDGRDTGAEILPNDPEMVRKYGRKIFIRRNLYLEPRWADAWRRTRVACLGPEHHADLTAAGRYERVLWHEIGHYLCPDTDALGRPFEAALGEDATLLEELKADLVAQVAVAWLARHGEMSEAERRAVMLAGTISGVRPARPVRSQVYPTLELMQLNRLLDDGAVTLDDAGLHVHEPAHDRSVLALLGEVLDLQQRGTKAESSALIERYSRWDQRNEQLAVLLKAQEPHRYTLITYPALGDAGFWDP